MKNNNFFIKKIKKKKEKNFRKNIKFQEFFQQKFN